MSSIDIGINESDRVNIAEGLKRLLADSYTLYLQTHNFHWNVTGPQFRELHLMFEEYSDGCANQGIQRTTATEEASRNPLRKQGDREARQ